MIVLELILLTPDGSATLLVHLEAMPSSPGVY